MDQMLPNLARNSKEALREHSADLGEIAVSAYRKQDSHMWSLHLLTVPLASLRSRRYSYRSSRPSGKGVAST
jgi:hypothetical protein